ncbi:MFS transporter [Stenotrophomonas rhizophila]|uniref:MFS transporter n=2 Tax=Stenotrophomonas rhizophila TaxID=216778 RepID=A0A498CFP1_9GAMM|nr:MFS transporter [Stenotrophomonas rhizophila]
MHPRSTPFIMLGTLLTAAGYGATFLISLWFRAHGGTDIDAGSTLGMALIGTLIGVPAVGWSAGRIDAARLAALGAFTLACGYALLASLRGLEPAHLPGLAALLIGLGWGMFYLGAPLALSERLTDSARGTAFTRFSAFQMTGICGSPILLALAVTHGGFPLSTAFIGVAVGGLVASLLLAVFALREPRCPREGALRPWVRSIATLGRSAAIRPIVMAGFGGAVFSGMMAFQGSLSEGTRASATTFFAVHAGTAVIARLLLARLLPTWSRTPLISCLLGCLIAGLACLLWVPVHPAFQIAAAVLTGAGYGLLYPVIQTWAVHGARQEDRHAALTWFVVAYFIGIFGFPPFGGWLLVTAGKAVFIWALVALAALELAVAVLKRRT